MRYFGKIPGVGFKNRYVLNSIVVLDFLGTHMTKAASVNQRPNKC